MKSKIYMIAIFLIAIVTIPIFGNYKYIVEGDCDSLETLKLYSLFSEYQKNKDYQSALPYGWQVLACDKSKFAKWIYYKMEDCLWQLHDSTDVPAEEKTAIADSMMNFYDMAIHYYPDAMAYFQVRKAFVAETWLKMQPDSVITMYEKAEKYNPEMDVYYYNRLGQLYIANMNDNNDYKSKAIDLYSKLAVREPDNPEWPRILSTLVEDVGQLLDIRKKNWELDKDNLEKAWIYASECIRAQDYQRALEPLEFLTKKAPETVNYWNQLATCYNKLGRYSDAEAAYQTLLKLEPDNKDFYFNLGLIYKEQGKLSKARQYFETANDKAGGWGMAIFSIGLLYEQAARDCTFDFKTKLVYLLAQETYRRAVSVDPNLAQARDRIGALSTSIPSKEDYFFQGYKSGDVIPITGECFTWIGKSVTVP
ncbi:MAG: tetratricopeptide repeat protein [Ignavibacteriaceae bacterium]